MAPLYEFLFLLFPQLMLLLLAVRDGKGYQGDCPPSFDCGYLGNISLPFSKTGHQDCGLLTIEKCDDHSANSKEIQLEKNGRWFDVTHVFQFPLAPTTIHIRDKDLYNLLQSKSCEAFSNNYSLPSGFLFASFHIKYNSPLFKCRRTLHVNPPKDFYNYTGCPDYDLYYNQRRA